MLVMPDPANAPAIVGTIKGGITLTHPITATQLSTMNAVAHQILKLDIDVEEVDPLTPAQAAEAIKDPAIRSQTVQAMIALEMLAPTTQRTAEEASGNKHRFQDGTLPHIEEYVRALDVKLPEMKTLNAIASDHEEMIYLDIFFRTPVRTGLVDSIKDSGLRNTIKAIGAARGHGSSPAVADKFKRLEDLPEGTWGYQLAHMYQANGWLFPGETGGPPETLSIHDWVHVLSGYPPSPVGELQVNSFIHACSEDPLSFGYMILALAAYGLGGFNPGGQKWTTKGDAYVRDDVGQLFAEAVMRSKTVGVDLFAVDHWGQANKTVEEMREKYSIPAKTVDIGDPDPGLPSYQP